jgi:hypothetical protein
LTGPRLFVFTFLAKPVWNAVKNVRTRKGRNTRDAAV